MQYEEMTEQIIGCAYRVSGKMAFGFLKSVYENCIEIELIKAGSAVKSKEPIKVFHEGEIVGEFVADLVVEDTVIVELKSIRREVKAHETQLVYYLVAIKIDVGLILNFGERKVEVKRKVRTLS